MSLATPQTSDTTEASASDGPVGYTPTRFAGPIDLDLSRNEGTCCLDDASRKEVASDPSVFERYPDTTNLESLIADRLGIDASRVLVTAGGDDAIERVCRIALTENGEATSTALLHTPTFEMIELYCRSCGAEIESIPWVDGPFPVNDMIARCNERCSLISLVSPNNPTGSVIPLNDMRSIVERACDCNALVLVDLAYVEFAAEDPTQALLAYDSVVMIRTFSKAWGLAGLRVGYAIGQPEMIRRMKNIGAPYAVSGLSLTAAEKALQACEAEMKVNVNRVKSARSVLTAVINRCGGSVLPTEANFTLARFENTSWIRDALAGVGIATRTFANNPSLNDTIRIACPTNESDLIRFSRAIESATSPEALLFDVDGVLVDVSRSYRRAIIKTAATFGVAIDETDVEKAKAAGDANNDWIVTQRLIAAGGVVAPLDAVQARFEQFYQGDENTTGLKAKESLIPSRSWLAALAQRLPLGFVTGRPRRDADDFIERFDLQSVFSAVVTLDDAPSKPDPVPIRLALQQLGVTRAWMIGDTPDDINAARAAGVIPLGINAPQADPTQSTASLQRAGAARVLTQLADIEDLLP